MENHIIDCDADPFLPNGWTVVEHQVGGQLEFDPSKFELYLSKAQQGSNWIEGDKLRKELEGKPVLNDNVLDYLLEHQHLIPDEWKGKYTFFWGTIYRCRRDRLRVRYLCWHGLRWSWRYRWLGYNWYDGYPAAVLAS